MVVRVILVSITLCLAQAVQAEDSRLDNVAKRGALRVCTPGDYKPFSLAKSDGTFEGLEVDLVQSMAKSLGVEAKFVKTAWPKLMDDFVEKCDIAVGGISVTLERQKRAFFSAPYMVNGKAPITKCENVAKPPDRRRHRQARRHGDRESRRQQRALRPRQFQAGEDRDLRRQHEDL
jgi:cyclohexadienyl dehydratase